MNLKLLTEIKRGCSKVEGFWIKHTDIEDEARLEDLSGFFLDVAIKRGVKTEAQAVEYAAKTGSWTTVDEARLKTHEAFLSRLEETYDKTLEHQKKYIEEDLLKSRIDVAEMLYKKRSALGKTAESWAGKMSTERYIISLFFKDKALSVPAVLAEDIEYLDDDELNFYYGIYIQHKNNTSEEKIKELACSIYCQNLFYVAEGLNDFFGVCAMESTILQQRLVQYMYKYKNIISNIMGKVQQDIYTDWKALDKWANSSEKSKEILESSWSRSDMNDNASFDKIKRAAEKESKATTREEELKSVQSLL